MKIHHILTALLFTLVFSITPVQAQTVSTSIIRENCSLSSIPTANCYTSLSAWEAGEQRDLVASNEVAIAQIEGTWVNPDVTALKIDGWTTSASNYIKIYTTPEARHGGVWDNAKYRLDVSASNDYTRVVYIKEDFVRVEGLQIQIINNNFNYNAGIYAQPPALNSEGEIYISRNIIRTTDSGGVGIKTITTNSKYYIYNNIIYGFNLTDSYGLMVYGTNYVFNNTVTNSYHGIRGVNGSFIFKNNISYNNTKNYYNFYSTTALDPSSTNNLSGPTQSGAFGSNPKDTTLVTFQDESNNNFLLSSTDTGAKDAGVNLSSDSNLSFTTDINGETRSGTWDIGADEYTGTIYTPPTLDTPPTQPTNLKVTVLSTSQITLSWTKSTDNNAVTGYKVYRNGSFLNTTTNNIYADSNLTPSTTYTYTVSAIDDAGKESIKSSSDSGTTQSVLPAQTDPSITSVTGNITENSIITINGINFTTKQNTKPLLWWKADFGVTPSPLGRKTVWDGTFNGTLVSTGIIAPGSSKAVTLDHGVLSAAILGRVDFNSDRIYLWRKKYDDFDVWADRAIRTRVNLLTGVINPGDIITGSTSGATGEVISVKKDYLTGVRTDAIFYSNATGTINKSTPVNFIVGETMTSSSGATMINAEGSSEYKIGTLWTFNNKILRWWAKYGEQQNNMYHVLGLTESNGPTTVTENTLPSTGSYPVNNWENPLYQLPYQWYVEEFIYQTSGIDKEDGISNYVQNGTYGYVNKRFQHRVSSPALRGQKYSQVFQTQVSNGAQPNSNSIFDSLYIDDTWHRVLICESSTQSGCTKSEIQIPTSWNDNQIKVSLNLGQYKNSTTAYLYVFNANGDVNTTGYPISITPTLDTPPTQPTNLKVTVLSTSQITLSWTKSTDNNAVTGYKVYRNGSFLNTTTNNIYADSNLTPSTTYTYTVSAIDDAGKESIKSSSDSGTTQSVLPAQTDPSITSVTGTLTQDSTITITGSNFGTKSQAAPIIYDFSDKAYINGTLDYRQSGLNEGDPILRDSNFYWEKSSNESNGSSFVRITKQKHRNTNISAHYTFD